MSSLYPTLDSVRDVFATRSPLRYRMNEQASLKSNQTQPKSDPYLAWSVVEDAKQKGKQLSTEARRELDQASQRARDKAGTIELYSPRYYAACTLGGIVACVSFHTYNSSRGG